MKSNDMANRLINAEEETTALILKGIPIAVLHAANKIINNVLIDTNFKDSTHEETLMYLFMSGYTTARQEDRLILEDTFLN